MKSGIKLVSNCGPFFGRLNTSSDIAIKYDANTTQNSYSYIGNGYVNKNSNTKCTYKSFNGNPNNS